MLPFTSGGGANGGGGVPLSQPTRLPNGGPQFASHLWIFQRTSGDISIGFYVAKNLPIFHQKSDNLHL